ncbi:MAG TPA: lytic transglycosylase domain-containing protein [Micromonosporaceae bacterium]|jgi:hypothetical protein|nr:lytic transglycosylase domain-containing protein [Micromonosporaceae bacterium]
MRHGVRTLVMAGTAVLTLVTGCAERDGTPGAQPDPVTTTGVAGTTPAPAVPAVQGIGASPKPSRTPTRRPSRRPPTETVLPPAPKPAPTNCTGPKYVGTAASRTDVKAALEAAAGKTYWPVSAPQIKIPVNLVKAVAWQESGWQSNVVSCDGGIGLMQVMAPTAAFINQRFSKSYDVNVYTDNAILGANYLAWLVKYFGDTYFAGNYDLTTQDPDNPVLLDAVIAAYNVGPGNVDVNNQLVIPNRQYVNNVEALMTNCVCLSY